MSLQFALVVVSVLDCHSMRVFLVLTAIGILVDPFPVIFRQPVEVDPQRPWSVSHHALRPVQVYGHLILHILDVSKSSCRVTVAVQIIILLLGEEGLIILMLEQLSLDCQPAIGVSHKLFVVLDWTDYLEIQIREVVPFSGGYGLHFPLVFGLMRNADQCLHLVPLPLNQKESLSLTLQLRHLLYL